MHPLVTLRSLRRRAAFILPALACLPQAALAALPTVQPPSAGSGGTGLFGTLQGYIAMAIILGGLVLAAGAFLVVGNGAVATFNEARERNQWGKFGAVVVVGVILIVAIIWLATQAATIL